MLDQMSDVFLPYSAGPGSELSDIKVWPPDVDSGLGDSEVPVVLPLAVDSDPESPQGALVGLPPGTDIDVDIEMPDDACSSTESDSDVSVSSSVDEVSPRQPVAPNVPLHAEALHLHGQHNLAEY